MSYVHDLGGGAPQNPVDEGGGGALTLPRQGVVGGEGHPRTGGHGGSVGGERGGGEASPQTGDGGHMGKCFLLHSIVQLSQLFQPVPEKNN